VVDDVLDVFVLGREFLRLVLRFVRLMLLPIKLLRAFPLLDAADTTGTEDGVDRCGWILCGVVLRVVVGSWVVMLINGATASSYCNDRIEI
jgi:hypothetical protein